MGSLDTWVNEARGYLSQILDALVEANQQREKAAEKPAGRVLSKLNVISEAQLETFRVEEGQLIKIIEVQQGVYLKINHWAFELEAAGTVRLYYGYSNQEAVGILDAFANNVTAFYASRDPNELVLPPGAVLFAKATKGGLVTVSSTRYDLSL